MFKTKKSLKNLTEKQIAATLLEEVDTKFLPVLNKVWQNGNIECLSELKELTNHLDEEHYYDNWSMALIPCRNKANERIDDIALKLKSKYEVQNGYYKVLEPFIQKYPVSVNFVGGISFDPSQEFELQEEAQKMENIATALEDFQQRKMHMKMLDDKASEPNIKSFLKVLGQIKTNAMNIEKLERNKASFTMLMQQIEPVQTLCNMLQYEITQDMVETSPTLLELNTLIGMISKREWHLLETVDEVKDYNKKDGNTYVIQKILSFFEEAIPAEDREKIKNEMTKPYIDIATLLKPLQERIKKYYSFKLQLLEDQQMRLNLKREETLYACYSENKACSKQEKQLQCTLNSICIKNNEYETLYEMTGFGSEEESIGQIQKHLIAIGKDAYQEVVDRYEDSYKTIAASVNSDLICLKSKIKEEEQRQSVLKHIKMTLDELISGMKWAPASVYNNIDWNEIEPSVEKAFETIQRRYMEYIETR